MISKEEHYRKFNFSQPIAFVSGNPYENLASLTAARW
jgi:hypothetical protein